MKKAQKPLKWRFWADDDAMVVQFEPAGHYYNNKPVISLTINGKTVAMTPRQAQKLVVLLNRAIGAVS